jgi:hypothetical protein
MMDGMKKDNETKRKDKRKKIRENWQRKKIKGSSSK